MAGSQMQLEDWLDDLCVRFIINLPEEDLSSVARLCFQVEEAQWFYEDFIRPLDPSLPSMSLRTFCLRIFQHCPLLASFSVENHTRAFEEFLQYKTRVPVRGAILLNHDMDATVLVKGWKKGANWSFPRGKINKDEDDLDCAVREVWEETGLDLRAAGLVPTEAKPKYIEITMREQQMRLYVFRDVPMDTNFKPQTRKEISKIQWYRLSELPAFRKKATQAQNQPEASSNANKFYMVAPFLVPLKKWVVSQKKTEAKKSAAIGNKNLNPHYSFDEGPTEDDTWPHAAATLPVHDPGLHTLQDATNELQRLLKVQPPTQGLQPPRSQEDKASALLSMLQLKDPSASQQQSQQLQQQLPLPSNQHAVSQPVPELTTGNVPQTRIPLYYTHRTRETEEKSMHQAADLLLQQTQHPNLHPHTSSHNQHQMESWNTNQVQMRPNFIQAGPQEFDGASSSYSQSHQAQLLHPQPLPPQVQRGMFSKNSFQESHQAAQAPSALPSGLQAQQHQQIQEQQLRSHSHSSALPPGETGHTEGPRPVRLDGQSMALLNAFKRDTGISPSAQPLQLQTGPQQDYDTQPTHSTRQRYGYQNQAQPLELAGSVGPKSHVASTKAEPLAHTNQHRSALLGMFSRQQVDSETNDGKAAPSAVQPQGSRELYSLGHDRLAQVNPDPVASQGSPSSNTGAALSDFLALKPRADQPAAATREVGFNANYGIGQPSGTQPIRILQRGQDAEAVGGLGSQPERPEPRSPYLQQSYRGPETFTSPSMSVSQPSPGESQRRPDAAHDQKRQLLSLFGKQQQQQQQLPGHQGQQSTQAFAQPAGEGASSQGSPSRAGNGTPMSPAEQTFLLGYLQSVTNTASR